AWGPFAPPGRPKARIAPPSGAASAWGPFAPPGRPKARIAPPWGAASAWGPNDPPSAVHAARQRRLRHVGAAQPRARSVSLPPPAVARRRARVHRVLRPVR